MTQIVFGSVWFYPENSSWKPVYVRQVWWFTAGYFIPLV